MSMLTGIQLILVLLALLLAGYSWGYKRPGVHLSVILLAVAALMQLVLGGGNR